METHACKLDGSGDGLFQVSWMSQNTFSEQIRHAQSLG
jgi:hypothetical protein